jgi:hypothetical protein
MTPDVFAQLAIFAVFYFVGSTVLANGVSGGSIKESMAKAFEDTCRGAVKTLLGAVCVGSLAGIVVLVAMAIGMPAIILLGLFGGVAP